MAGYKGSCSTNLGATGVGKVCVNWSNLSRFWRAVPGFYFESEADAQDKDKVLQAIQDEKLFPFPLMDAFEVNDEDTVMDEQAMGTAFIRIGKKTWKIKSFSNPYTDQILRSHSNAPGGWFHIDALGGYRGVRDLNDANKPLYPIPYQMFVVEKPEENNGSDSSFKSVFSVGLNDAHVNTYLDKAAIVEGADITWDALSIDGLTPVELEVVSATATSIVVNATIAGTSIPVTSLDLTPSADFVVKTAAGVEIVPTLISEAGDTGVYTFTVVGLVTGDTVSLLKPSLMASTLLTGSLGYKGDKLVPVTVA